MTTLFKKRKKKEATGKQEGQDRLIKAVVYACLRWQSEWALWVERKTECLSIKGKRIALVIFVLVTGGYSLFLMGRSVTKNQTLSFPITFIKRPVQMLPREAETTKANTLTSQSEYVRVHRFKRYMDSLARSPSGKQLYDNIVIHRPGLRDSLQLIESLYQAQSTIK